MATLSAITDVHLGKGGHAFFTGLSFREIEVCVGHPAKGNAAGQHRGEETPLLTNVRVVRACSLGHPNIRCRKRALANLGHIRMLS
jgi:hypothetical protein